MADPIISSPTGVCVYSRAVETAVSLAAMNFHAIVDAQSRAGRVSQAEQAFANEVMAEVEALRAKLEAKRLALVASAN